MKCLECGTDLPDTATSCPRCGTPTHAITSFSYLPAGTPPWPATVPQGTSSTATAVKDPAQTAASARSVAEAKPRRSVGSIFTAFLLLLLSVVVGVGATLAILAATGSLASTTTATRQIIHLPTPIPTATVAAQGTTGTGTPAATPTTGAQGNQLPTPTSFVIVKIAGIGVSLKYPADWTEKPPQTDSMGVTVSFTPQQQNGIAFFVEQFLKSGSTQFTNADQVNQSVLQQISATTQFSNFHEVSPTNPTPTIAGMQWAERDATFANSQGIPFHSVSISVRHNNLYYNIFYFAPTSVFDEAMQKYYSQMLSSFQFIS